MSFAHLSLTVPSLGPAEAAALAACVESGWVSSASPQVGAFESALCAYTGSPHAVAVSSGSAALSLALEALGLLRGDLVIMPTLTFIATANAVIHLGGEIILADVDAQTWLLKESLVEEFLQNECEVRDGICRERKSGRRVWGILTVDAMGQPVNASTWRRIADAFHLRWVSDSAASMGSLHSDRHAGIGADAATISFNGNKIMTTGAGGAVLTAVQALADRVRWLAGQCYAPDRQGGYVHNGHGYNALMSGIAAALGMAQLSRMEEFLQSKKRIHQFYLDALAQVPGLCPWQNADPLAQPNHWLMNVAVNDPAAVQQTLASSGIETRRLWLPLHLQALLQGLRYLSDHDEAAKIYGYGLSLPCSISITNEELTRVSSCLVKQ